MCETSSLSWGKGVSLEFSAAKDFQEIPSLRLFFSQYVPLNLLVFMNIPPN